MVGASCRAPYGDSVVAFHLGYRLVHEDCVTHLRTPASETSCEVFLDASLDASHGASHGASLDASHGASHGASRGASRGASQGASLEASPEASPEACLEACLEGFHVDSPAVSPAASPAVSPVVSPAFFLKEPRVETCLASRVLSFLNLIGPGVSFVESYQHVSKYLSFLRLRW